MLSNCLLVAGGGGLGAVCRYLLGLLPCPVAFPLMTLCINIAGGFAIGFFVGQGERLNPQQLLFLKTGLCGGFTTFSTFSLESLTLLEQGRVAMAVLYMTASVLFCVLGVLLGRMVAQSCGR